MYRRYLIIGFVFLLLIGAYFMFFDNKNEDNTYGEYCQRLLNKGAYSDSLEGVDLDIDKIEESNKFSYIITFDNVVERKDNIKVLVLGENSVNKETFPSFGIIDNKGYSLILNSEEKEEKEIKGLNLTILDSEEIEYMLIYFSGNEKEQFVRIKVSDYLD